MLERLQQIILKITVQAEQQAETSLIRRFFISAGRIARKPGEFAANLQSLGETALLHERETSSWVNPETLATGAGGPFDACDLRHWLILAELAGVPFIPAREVLHLTEDEISALSGEISIPSTPATRRLQKAAEQLLADSGTDAQDSAITITPIDREALFDRLFDAMDDVPEGWMVRSNRCGSSELKALAGVGAIGERAPEVRFGPNLEVGPGWVRIGNRRRINVSDKRTLSAAAEGPGFLTFLARPWIESSRYIVAPDPHREGSPFAGKGVWPAEWRAFVENNQVVGVASYYGWADSPTPHSARTALEARRLAQLIVDEAVRQQAWPRYPGIELARNASWVKSNPELDRKINVDFGRETVSCTLDFIETDKGLLLLEGGPGASPLGGGHPCAFAGASGAPTIGKPMKTEGVAFHTMPHVLIADPSTWQEGDTTGCILSWDEVETLARESSEEEAASN